MAASTVRGMRRIPGFAQEGALPLQKVDCPRHITTFATGLVVAVLLGMTVGCGQSEDGLHVQGSVQKLRAQLKAHGVRLDGSAGSVQSAWAAFKEFARIRVAADEVVSGAEGDGFLLQWGTYERVVGHGDRTFQVEFTRQYVLRSDDIQQVHLVVNFSQAPLDIASGNGIWSFDLPGDRASQVTAWIDDVESSRLFGAITAPQVTPLAYDVWQDSAE